MLAYDKDNKRKFIRKLSNLNFSGQKPKPCTRVF